jgi:hypothetical protein
MMETIDFTLAVDQPLSQAQTQILDRVDSRLRSAGLTRHEKGDAVEYQPRFIGLVFVWMVRRLSGEHVTFSFEERGRTTEVRVTGKLRKRAHAQVTEAFGGV